MPEILASFDWDEILVICSALAALGSVLVGYHRERYLDAYAHELMQRITVVETKVATIEAGISDRLSRIEGELKGSNEESETND